MAARLFFVPARANLPRAHRIVPLSLFVPLLLGFFPTLGWCLAVSDTGRWTPASALTGIPVHMALTRGHGPYHSKILWYYGLGKDQNSYGGLLGWKPGEYNCTGYPDTSILTPIALPLPDSAGLFCSGHSSLADGRLFVAGGTQPGTEFGVRHAYIFDPVAIAWTKVDTMSQRRWYPTSTTLASGKQLVTSGSQDVFLNFHFGRLNADAIPADSAVFRYGVGANGITYDPVRTSSTPLWPSPREGQVAVLRGSETYLFGGKDRNGTPMQDSWRMAPDLNPFGADLDYRWFQLAPAGTPPPARWDHSAVSTANPTSHMMVFGGTRKVLGQDTTGSDVWRLWNHPTEGLKWQQVTILSSSESPGARCGHATLWRKATTSDSAASVFGRLLVFGGRGSPTGNPTDSSLWSLNFTSTLDSATWVKLTATGPSPRFHHALAHDASNLPDTAYVFGGETSGGQKLQDLWRLNVNSLTWTSVGFLQGSAPSARSRHSATLATGIRVLYIFGGRSDDSTVHVAQLGGYNPAMAQTWTTYRAHNPAISGHTATLQSFPQSWARVPEIFDPGAGVGSQWSQLNNAPRFQNWYPQGFMWKADTVFFSGPELFTYKFAMNSQTWNQFPSSSSGFFGGAAVMYRPGRVMKCGLRDVEQVAEAVGTTKSLYLGAPDSAQWRPSANLMQPRVNHNLVLLPNGKVLVVGGTGTRNASVPRYKPEIWDPDFNNGQGRWSGLDTLAAQAIVRDYHSVAILLPDGRVVSSGGEHDGNTRHLAEIFCPPYLFKSDGTLASRPGTTGSPQRVRYGAQFSLCLSTTDTISTASLIRPAATTHGQDENQRFVPLTFTQSWAPLRITATAPADSFDAPPGDYMLFAVNTKGVPSVARWVRMGFAWSESPSVPPDSIVLVNDFVTSNSVNLTWTASGDDGMAGTASYTELRYSLSPIVTGSHWDDATRVTPQPVPVCGGVGQARLVTGLNANTHYYFAIKTSDESENMSPIGRLKVTTTGECCGGEVRAGLARDDEPRAGSGDATTEPSSIARAAQSTAAAAAGSGTGLLLEAIPGASGFDLRVTSLEGESFDGYPLSSNGGVLRQLKDGSGEWRTDLHYDLPPESRFALCTPGQATRWAILAPSTVEQVLTEVRGTGAASNLDGATHSRTGDVATAVNEGSLPEMLPGDVLTLRYTAVDEDEADRSGWILVMERPVVGPGSTRAGGRAPEKAPSNPVVYGLMQNQPNPFATATTIAFTLPAESQVRLEIYDLLGRRVRTLANRLYPPGEHQVVWNRRTGSGAIAAPGLYFYRMDAGQYREKRRMVILP